MIAITKKNVPNLLINLDDTFITIEKRGTYNNKEYFSWSSLEPSESTEMLYSSELIDNETLTKRLSMVSYAKDLLPEEQYAIKLFVEEK